MAPVGISKDHVNDAKDVKETLEAYAQVLGQPVNSRSFAEYMDNIDPLKEFRGKFKFPQKRSLGLDEVDKDEGIMYFAGNSLGLQPRTASKYVEEVLESWANLGVETHFEGLMAAAFCDQPGKAYTAELVGAMLHEVSILNGLTVNLHLMLAAFYKPTKDRYKIMFEGHAFPSDRYAFNSVVKMSGYDPKDALIMLQPRKGEDCLRHEDILAEIKRHGRQVALICFSGIQYFTGQLFDIPEITRVGREQGCVVGWDLAHAIGNVKLSLHDWDVDFAVWCSYKYVNSGPGGIAGLFLHDRFADDPPKHMLGWWSNAQHSRFKMAEEVELARGADSFRLCNPPPLLAAANYASLEIFHEAGMSRITAKQVLITGFLEFLIKKHFPDDVKIITPTNIKNRGSQLSLQFKEDLTSVHEKLKTLGVVCDTRDTIMRIAPAPLYNSFVDVWRFIHALKLALKQA